MARRVVERAQERFRDPIVTAIEPAQPFWRAEEYHQCYLQNRSSGLLGTLLGLLEAGPWRVNKKVLGSGARLSH